MTERHCRSKAEYKRKANMPAKSAAHRPVSVEYLLDASAFAAGAKKLDRELAGAGGDCVH